MMANRSSVDGLGGRKRPQRQHSTRRTRGWSFRERERERAVIHRIRGHAPLHARTRPHPVLYFCLLPAATRREHPKRMYAKCSDFKASFSMKSAYMGRIQCIRIAVGQVQMKVVSSSLSACRRPMWNIPKLEGAEEVR